MPRTITLIAFDLKFDVASAPPTVIVSFVDRDASGHEQTGRTYLTDAVAAKLFPAGIIDAVNAQIDAQAAAVKDPAAVTDRITAAADAQQRFAAANAATSAAQKTLKDLEMATKAQQSQLDQKVAAAVEAQKKLDALVASAVAIATAPPPDAPTPAAGAAKG